MVAHQPTVVSPGCMGPRVQGPKGPRVRWSKGLGAVLALVGAFVCLAFISAPGAFAPSHSRTLGPRIVSLVPAVTEMLFAMGAGPDVVGVSSYDRFPPEVLSKPKVGALVDPDFERILSLRPELVIVYGSQIDLIGRLERARVPMFRYEHAGLPDITTTIRALGARVGRGADARALADRIERDLADIRRRVEGKRRPKTVLIFGREEGALRGIFASGGIGFMHDMLEAAGGEDIFADVKRQSVQATVEVLLARAPEVIIEVHAGEAWTADRIARETAVWRGLPSLPAARSGRLHILVDDRLSMPGPRVADAVRILADVLHGPAKQGAMLPSPR